MGKGSKYRAGRRVEWRARDFLESFGYTVIRSAKSGGRWDLIAIQDDLVRLIQVKKGKPIPSAYKAYFPLKRNLALVVEEIWFYEPRKGFTIIYGDGKKPKGVFLPIISEETKNESHKDTE